MTGVPILLLAGGVRDGSLNEKLVAAAAAQAEALGHSATRLSLTDYPLPLFGASPAGLADVPAARALKAMFRDHAAIILASPEHNGSVTAMMKNAKAWISCASDREAPPAYSAFRGKPFGLMSASSSPFGGLRGLSQLRHILASVHALVVPEQLSVPHAHRAFDEQERLGEPLLATILRELVGSVTDLGARTAATGQKGAANS